MSLIKAYVLRYLKIVKFVVKMWNLKFIVFCLFKMSCQMSLEMSFQMSYDFTFILYQNVVSYIISNAFQMQF